MVCLSCFFFARYKQVCVCTPAHVDHSVHSDRLRQKIRLRRAGIVLVIVVVVVFRLGLHFIERHVGLAQAACAPVQSAQVA